MSKCSIIFDDIIWYLYRDVGPLAARKARAMRLKISAAYSNSSKTMKVTELAQPGYNFTNGQNRFVKVKTDYLRRR